MRRGFLTALALVSATAVAGDPTTRQLSPFHTVQVNVPFNTLIQPATGNTYSVSIDAEQAVKDKFRATLLNNILALDIYGSIQTSQPVLITVILPASQLQEVDVSSSAQVSVAGGFSANPFTATNTGSSRLSFLGLNAPTVNVQYSGQGSGSVVVDAANRNVRITGSSVGSGGVKYNRGQCNVQGTFPASICKQDPNLRIPPQ
ncbi:hypothetical protein WJX72_007448 [[Myrmecia] bisecta]|uniref:Putative auto-transporter adhesin head GIN domain-containing protein n=1 Tax=[Myrmecia] bisecta TaxID=41462 RepID=A0AAW1R7U4_9CHLO